MEAIKISRPNKSIMESTLTEQECDELINKIKIVMEAEDFKSAMKENFPEAYNEALKEDTDFASMLTVGVIYIGVIIAFLIKWIKNKYRLTVNKLMDQSKELNDIYTKIEDILAHDKMARFKHRNDMVSADIEDIVMKDKNTGKIYKLTIDNIAYDPDYFINQIKNILQYTQGMSNKEKSENIVKMVENLRSEVRQSFMNEHGFVLSCEPIVKITHYNKIKLEKVILIDKDWIESIYNILYICNQNASGQLTYLQLLQQAYNKLSVEYKNDKEAKKAVDDIFKDLLKNITISMEFNSKSMKVLDEMIHHYAEDLEKIYETLKS